MPTVHDLPFPLGGRLQGVAGDLLSSGGEHVDFGIGGIPFKNAADRENPFLIATVPLQKEQFDQERDPGEQSLSGWWRRAQQTFSGGAGFVYQEDREGSEGTGFFNSSGIDVFGTPGEIKLLRQMVITGSNGYSKFKTSTDAYSWVKAGALAWGQTEGTPAFTYDPVPVVLDGGLLGPWGAGGAGAIWWALLDDGTVAHGVGNSIVPTAIIDISASAGQVATGALFAKGRLWAYGNKYLWAIELGGAASQPPIFTNQNSVWTYTDVTPGPTGVYFVGNDGWKSEIQLVSLDPSGAVPALTGAAVTAQMPPGELAVKIHSLANTYMGIGSKTGFRVGAIDADGSITYGPQFIAKGGGGTCSMLTSWSNFFIVSFQTLGNFGDNHIIDTSAPNDDGSMPHAPYVSASSVALESGFMDQKTSTARFKCVTVTGEMRLQSATLYVDSGWIQTGNIRFRTLEDKTFRQVSITAQSLKGSITTEIFPSTGGSTQVGVASVQDSPVNEGYSISLPPVQYLSVKFTLTADDPNTGTPIMNSWQVKAIPSVSPQREFTIPLLCNDFEDSYQGLRYGYQGFADERYQALVLIEQTGQLIQLQDLNSVVNAPIECSIEALQYVRSTNHTKSSDGGVITIKLRTVN